MNIVKLNNSSNKLDFFVLNSELGYKVIGVLSSLSTIFQLPYIVAVSFIDEETRVPGENH